MNNIESINKFKPYFDQYWDMVKDVIDNTEGWIYSNDVPHILDYYFEANTGKEIEFQKIYDGEYRGYRWRPKSISLIK